MQKAESSRTKFENGHVTMFISDHDHILSYDLLSDLYAAFKKLLEQSKYHLSITGTFRRIGNTEIKCEFFLNPVYAEQEKIDLSVYRNTFYETYPYWSTGFNSLIQSIIFDIKHSELHSKESKSIIVKRVSNHYISGLKARRIVQIDPVQEKISQNRAERKATNAKRKAEARAKKAAKQDLSHQD